MQEVERDTVLEKINAMKNPFLKEIESAFSQFLISGDVIDATNAMVTMSVAIIAHRLDVSFIHFSPCILKFECCSVNT